MLNRTRKAFTMIELIVVIVILGILALIAIPTYNAVINRTRIASVERAGEALGREAVALAAFTDNQVVTDAILTEAKGDLTVAERANVSTYLSDADGPTAGTSPNQTGTGTLPGFTVTKTFGGNTYKAVVTVDGTVVKAAGSKI